MKGQLGEVAFDKRSDWILVIFLSLSAKNRVTDMVFGEHQCEFDCFDVLKKG